MSDSTDNSDRIERAKRGDKNACCELLSPILLQIEGWAKRKINPRFSSVISAEDIAQETAIAACVGMPRFRGTSDRSFAAWVWRLARSRLQTVIRWAKAEKRDPERLLAVTAQDSSVAFLDRLAADSATPSRVLATREAVAALQLAIAKLQPDEQTVISLYELQGLEIEAVAKQVNRTPGAVYMVRSRAIERLEELLHFSGGTSRF